jgi:hypothetical protein
METVAALRVERKAFVTATKLRAESRTKSGEDIKSCCQSSTL